MIINGNALAQDVLNRVRIENESFRTPVQLGVISVGHSAVVDAYIRIKKRRALEVGIIVTHRVLEESISEEDILSEIDTLIKKTDALIVQLPIPEHLSVDTILNRIPETHDADVLGRYARDAYLHGDGVVMPPVAQACAYICAVNNVPLSGAHAVVLGKGRLVGIPVEAWLRKEGALVESIDEQTPSAKRKSILEKADIVVSGVGKPGILLSEDVREGVVVLDAGASETGGVIAGDADPQVATKSSLFAPVPGGIGPLAVAFLLQNAVTLARSRLRSA